MVTLLIGHRGTGKTSFLRGLKDVQVFDLDEEIARAHGRDLFAQGEVVFRERERAVLSRLLGEIKAPAVIAVGAGFEGPIPQGVQVLWLRRQTDASGRCFLNRPRLHPELPPYAEYQERFSARERRFADWAHEELFLPEGYVGGLQDFVSQPAWQMPWDLTLLAENFRSWSTFYAKRMRWNLRRWELRDDLLSEEQIEIALATIPREQILFSRRRRSSGVTPAGCSVDWALELGEPPDRADVVSLHELEDDFESTLKYLNRFRGSILKLAVEINNFSELKRGHDWWLEDSAKRAFLPRSRDGRWRWYRSLFGPRMPLHFIREGLGSSLDQPLLWQCVLQPEFRSEFGAVLGQPVQHSRSPMEHMSALKIPFLAIDVPEEEFTCALDFLHELGLRFAAVTSPLKQIAWAHAHRHTSESRRTRSANTLLFHGEVIHAHNTDVLALHQLRDLDYENIWLWGGGGVKSSVKEVWPEVREFSARQGCAGEVNNPDLVIWATGRSRQFVFPPPEVRPRLVLDLNYGEDSPGLEWAVRDNLNYQSGLEMFKVQARFQREFWSRGEP